MTADSPSKSFHSVHPSRHVRNRNPWVNNVISGRLNGGIGKIRLNNPLPLNISTATTTTVRDENRDSGAHSLSLFAWDGATRWLFAGGPRCINTTVLARSHTVRQPGSGQGLQFLDSTGR